MGGQKIHRRGCRTAIMVKMLCRACHTTCKLAHHKRVPRQNERIIAIFIIPFFKRRRESPKLIAPSPTSQGSAISLTVFNTGSCRTARQNGPSLLNAPKTVPMLMLNQSENPSTRNHFHPIASESITMRKTVVKIERATAARIVHIMGGSSERR